MNCTRFIRSFVGVAMLLLAGFVGVDSVRAGGATDATSPLSVLPRPAYESISGDRVSLAAAGHAATISLPDKPSGAIEQAVALLKRRAKALGFDLTATEDGKPASIRLSHCSKEELVRSLGEAAGSDAPDAFRTRQSYVLKTEGKAGTSGLVNLRACDDWGLYYGVVSLCQLLEADGSHALTVPISEIRDCPEIGRRLAKISASDSPIFVNRYAALLPLFKISQLGLQYHGMNSKEPQTEFIENIKTVCPRLRREGNLETIVYFCPFRGKGPRGAEHPEGAYDLSNAKDFEAYTDFLLSILAQESHGIEIDYNDWPGSKGVPIADVINRVCEVVRKKYPETYVLYCSPSTGPQAYNLMATPETRATLTAVPPYVWPLWVGLKTRTMEHPEKAKPLTVEESREWAKRAGRRPFLWINRVAYHVQWSLSRKVPGTDGYAFAGDLFPRELNRCFEGVHLNTGRLTSTPLYGEMRPTATQVAAPFDRDELRYLATTADFLWNPAKWDAAESYRRATRFVEIMCPAEAADTPTPSGK